MSFKIGTIASGSSGNSSIILSGNTFIMTDCGISLKKAMEGLSELGISQPDALLITHPHTDHIKGAHILAKKFDIPVYTTEETKKECILIPKEQFITVKEGESFYINDVSVTPFASSHDTPSSLGFTFTTSFSKVSILTDTGLVTEEMFSYLKGSEGVIIESNHDEEMLKNGPYPYFLKARIKSEKGHLSNLDCAKVCRELLLSGTKNFLLAHLSEHNNTEDLAFNSTFNTLRELNFPFNLKIAKKSTPCLF